MAESVLFGGSGAGVSGSLRLGAGAGRGLGRGGSFRLMARHSRSPRHRHSRESGNPEHFRQWHGSLHRRVLDSRFRGNDGGGRPTGMPPVWPGPPLGMMGGGAIPPGKSPVCPLWIPAFAGMTVGARRECPRYGRGRSWGLRDAALFRRASPRPALWIPAFAGMTVTGGPGVGAAWIPAFAGMMVGAAMARRGVVDSRFRGNGSDGRPRRGGRRGFPLPRE